MTPRRRRTGFTLIEMLAVMLLLSMVVTAAVSFYLQLSRESNAAAARLRTTRRTVAALDRIARDLEATVLVAKPDAVDPLQHPWVFFAESSRRSGAANRLRFTTRSHRPRGAAANESDLAVVAYGLREGEAGDVELVRWSSPHLPEGLDRSVPLRDEDGAQVLTEGVRDFALRFLSDEGAWQDAWDSSALAQASRLPLAVEVALALAGEPESDGLAREAAEEEEETETLVRRVLLPLRPLDFEALFAGRTGGEDDDEEDEEDDPDCVTVDECVAAHPEIDVAAALEEAGLPPNLLDAAGRQCAETFSGVLSLPEDCL
jgi:type II secretion system protein J